MVYAMRVGWADSGSSLWSFNLPEKVDLNSTQGALYLTPSMAAAVSPALSYLARLSLWLY